MSIGTIVLFFAPVEAVIYIYIYIYIVDNS